MKNIKKCIALFFFSFTLTALAFSLQIYAKTIQFQQIDEESFIRFIAKQNNSEVKGGFPKFRTELFFNPDDLGNSYIIVIVDMLEIQSSYDEVVNALKDKDWFFIDEFKEAIFETQSFQRMDKDRFMAKGILTIKDQSIPISFTFDLLQFDKEAVVKGRVNINRLDFGVGWGDTSTVADEVIIEFQVKATRID